MPDIGGSSISPIATKLEAKFRISCGSHIVFSHCTCDQKLRIFEEPSPHKISIPVTKWS